MQISRRLLDRPHTKTQLLDESALKGHFTYTRITLKVYLPHVGKTTKKGY